MAKLTRTINQLHAPYLDEIQTQIHILTPIGIVADQDLGKEAGKPTTIGDRADLAVNLPEPHVSAREGR